MPTRVESPDGTRWTVRRRWAPRLGAETLWGRFHRRYRQTVSAWGRASDVDPGCLDVLGEGLVVALAVLVAVLLLVFVVSPLLLALIDLLLVIGLAIAGLVGRVVLRRPWIVEARAGDRGRTWRVVGWSASREHERRLATQLAAGITPSGGAPFGDPPTG